MGNNAILKHAVDPPHKAKLKLRGHAVIPKHDCGCEMSLIKVAKGIYALECSTCSIVMPLVEKIPEYADARAALVGGRA